MDDLIRQAIGGRFFDLDQRNKPRKRPDAPGVSDVVGISEKVLLPLVDKLIE
jgi:hypothetical protein